MQNFVTNYQLVAQKKKKKQAKFFFKPIRNFINMCWKYYYSTRFF